MSFWRKITILSVLLWTVGLAAVFAQHKERHPVSPIIYPPKQRALRFDHSHPEHKKLRCMQCHVQRAGKAGASDAPLVSAELCMTCHALAEDATDHGSHQGLAAELSPGRQKQCAYCHRLARFDSDAPLRIVPISQSAARIKFSHRRHATYKVGCVRCHQGVAQRQSLPSMRSCLACHSKSPRTSKTTCTTCHLSLADGRMKSRYKEGWLNPPRWLGGMHHDLDFKVTHRWLAADNAKRCSSCHVEKECVDCHDGKVRPQSIHPNDFLSTHAQLARRKSDRCTSCHATQSFCAACHARLGVATTSAPNVRSSGRFHPPTAVWVQGPSRHAIEAQRSMSSCISCHAEQDCVACHGALGLGAGISPHPAGFAARCRQFLGSNDRACKRCHVDLSGLCM